MIYDSLNIRKKYIELIEEELEKLKELRKKQAHSEGVDPKEELIYLKSKIL